MSKKLRVLECFSGIGACSKALDRLGVDYEIVDSVEIDKYAVKSFNAIHGTNFEPQDITKWDKDIECDLIMHGSPCQDFSVAGLGAGGDENSGTRSSLLYETIRIVEKLKPKYVIWENVKNVLSKKHKHNFDAYCERMEKLGYKNFYKVLNAKNFGVPQNRERVFTISIRQEGEMTPYYEFPEGKPLTIRLKDVLEKNVDEKFYLTKEQVQKIKLSTYNTTKTRIQGDISQTLCARDYKDPKCIEEPQVTKIGSRWGNHQAGQIYDREGLSPTLDTGQGGSRTPMFAEPEIIELNKNPKHQRDLVQDSEGVCRTIPAGTHGSTPHLLKTAIQEPTIEYIGGIGDKDRIGDGKELSRNFPSGNRVYNENGIAIAQTAQGGGLGGTSGLYVVNDSETPITEAQPIKRRRTEYGKEVRKAYENGEMEHSEAMKENYISNDGIMPTLTTSKREQIVAEPVIAASRGRGENNEQQLEINKNGTTNTITSVQKDNYVLEKADKAYKDIVDEMPEMFNPYNNSEVKDIAPTQTTQCGSTTSSATVLLKEKLCNDLVEKGVVKGGEVINHSYTTSEQRPTLDKYIENKEGIMPTITTRPDCLGYVENEPSVRIRKLTPKETWRLMGFDDSDFEKAEKVNSNSQLYKQAGNSIVVNVLEQVLKNLIPKEYYKNEQ